jgi:UDP-N-acetylmuramate dehydrogenase
MRIDFSGENLQKMVGVDQTKEFAVGLWNRYPNRVSLNEPLCNYTTYRVGGPATALCFPESKEELQDIISSCHTNDIPFFILGGGSNILVHDNGLNMIVLHLKECCSEIFLQDKRIYAGAGVLVSDLVGYCEEHSLAGLDFMSGIPGTLGGALRMNAGAFVGEIGDRVISIEAMSREGHFLTIRAEEAGFGYRRAENLQDKIILGCYLKLDQGDRTVLEKSRVDYLEKRAAKHPLDYGSCGSVFKRPTGGYAGTLIEKAGCKSMRIGGAMVSPKHANFIINYQNATAWDIFQLIQKVQRIVYEKFKTWLELEVNLVGFTIQEKESVKNPAA